MNVVIGGDQAFGVQLAERDMRRPLIRPDLAQTVQREIDALTDADSSSASEQERIGWQVIGPAQLLPQQLIVLWRERSGQILGPWREVLAADEVRLDGVAIGGQIVEPAAEAQQVVSAGFIAQGRILFAHPAEPAEQMGIAAKLREPADSRKGSLKIAGEAVGHTSMVGDGIAAQSQGQRLDVCLEDLFEAVSGLTHKICEEPKRVRLPTAQAYSRHTSSGASWT